MKRNQLIIWLLCVASALYAQELVLPFTATELTPEQKSSNPDYVAYPKPLKAEMPEMQCVTPAEGLGPFSVSATTQVMFSPGNLQFNAATGTHQCADGTTKPGTWRFAEHQWDIVGMGYGQTNTSNYCYIGGTVTGSDNRQIGISYSGWIDLFGWGTSGWNSGANQYQPYSTSASYSDYYPGGSASNNLTGV